MGSEATVNPITYEIVRNRLIAVSDEMRIALQSVSGSPTVTEATDFFTGLFLPDGTFVTMGLQVTLEAPPVGAMVRYIQSKSHASIRPGDMFIGNDPYIGALHQNDLQLIGPIFYEDQLIAWAGVMAHQTDLGGMDFASWSPKAREIFQEGLRIPAVKLVDGGEVREDVLEFILTASRLPAALELDIRAFIATLYVAQSRISELTQRYNVETVTATMQHMIAVSEERTRARLRELPDAEIHVTDFLEHDGHQNILYKVDLYMTKKGDSLRLDFSGSSRQAPGFINATRSGLHGGVAGSVIPVLGFKIPWNEGILRPVEIIAPDGLICTAQHPSPVGSATVETVWVITNVVSSALNKLFACSQAYASRAQAGNSGTMATFNMGGINQFGERFGLHSLDPMAGGFGAYATKDGIDAGGPLCVPVPGIADVEANEQVAPLRYLYRRLGRDTGGAGRFRGGRAAEMAVTLGGIDAAEILIMTHGAEVPNSAGQFGGWPGSTVRQRFGQGVLPHGEYAAYQRTPQSVNDASTSGIAQTISHERRSSEPEDSGRPWKELGPKPGLMPMTKEDVFAVLWQGGGGWGDPLDRNPISVELDVQNNIVSQQVAYEIYGVVIGKNGIDVDLTKDRRLRIRQQRIGSSKIVMGTPEDASAGFALGPALRLIQTEEGWQVRSQAGHVLSTNTTAWRAGAIAKPVDAHTYPGPITLHEHLTMTAFYCPLSGTLLSIDIHEKDIQPQDDILLDLASFARLVETSL